MRLGFSTRERWYSQAKDTADPLAALGRKGRADPGRTWALAPELLALLAAQYQRDPRGTVQLPSDNLAAEIATRPDVGALPSYQTVRRRMQEPGGCAGKGRGHPPAGQQHALDRRDAREVRSFEASPVHGLWHLDFHQARVTVLDAAGRWHTPRVLASLDDHSRLCGHRQGSLAETAECLVHGLTQALLKRGLPRALLTDNGAAMLAAETRAGLARLGIVHETTLPYSPYQNGKQEVFWAPRAGRRLELLRDVTPVRLAFLNPAAQAWVEPDSHRRPRRGPPRARSRRASPGVQPAGPPAPAPERRPRAPRGGARRRALAVPYPDHADAARSALGSEPGEAPRSPHRPPPGAAAAAGQSGQRQRAAAGAGGGVGAARLSPQRQLAPGGRP